MEGMNKACAMVRNYWDRMLKAWKKVSVDDLETIENMFQSLDASGDGVLNAEDISEQRDHRASMMMMQAGASGRSKMRV